jgi:hypothetical protein
MERFTVYPHPDNRGYLLNIQADSIGHLGSRVVIPLLRASEYRLPASRLNPQFEMRVRLNTWTGLCGHSQALPVFERAESA